MDVFQIMPNHMHGIINVGAALAAAPRNKGVGTHVVQGAGASPAPTVDIVANSENAATALTAALRNTGARAHVVQGAGASPAPTVDIVANSENAATALTAALRNTGARAHVVQGAGASPAPTVGDIICAYESIVANECLNIYKYRNETMGKLWQRNYYEHIIRNEESYANIANYILNNPANWTIDTYFPPTTL